VRSTADFETFWKYYPKKKGKGQAIQTWKKLEKSNSLPEVGEMLKAIKNQVAEKNHLANQNKFVAEWKYPSTWLNGYCWADDVDVPEKVQRPVSYNSFQNLERAYSILCSSGEQKFREFCATVSMSSNDIEAVMNKKRLAFDVSKLTNGMLKKCNA